MSPHHDIPSSPIILTIQTQHIFSSNMLTRQKINFLNNAMMMIIFSLVKILTTLKKSH